MAIRYLGAFTAVIDETTGDTNQIAEWGNTNAVPSSVTIRLNHGLGSRNNLPITSIDDLSITFKNVQHNFGLSGWKATYVDRDNIDITQLLMGVGICTAEVYISFIHSLNR